jgi:hypothetical protein
VEAAFKRDADLTAQYHARNGGKWAGMMLQTHIGYTSWQQPETQVMPEVRRVASGRPVAETAIPVPAQPSGEIVAIDAASFARATGGKGLSWQAIPDLGRTAGAILALPQGRAATTVEDGIRLQYDVRLARAGDAVLQLYMVPTLDTRGIGGIRIAVSIDDRPAQTLRFDLIPNAPAWNQAVRDNAHILSASFPALAAGSHRIISGANASRSRSAVRASSPDIARASWATAPAVATARRVWSCSRASKCGSRRRSTSRSVSDGRISSSGSA